MMESSVRDQLIGDINAAIKKAGSLMDFEDLGDASDDAYNEAIEERQHCGVCQVRFVMAQVMPAVLAYTNALEEELVPGERESEVFIDGA